MAQRAKVRDLVIVVPGMLGSRLLHNRVPLWGDDSPSFLAWIRRHGDDLGPLAIGADDPELDDLGDGVTAEGVLEHPWVAGRFLRIGGYGALLAFLQKNMTLRLGENLQVLAYDWRRDLEVAARRLSVRAEGWLKAWRARSGNAKARVVLVAHAMGGLVARHYTDVLGGWPEVRKLVTLGAPFLGSVRALDLLYFGADFRRYNLPYHDITPIARTLTSVYQLLPQYPSIHTFTGEIVSPFDVRIPTFELQKMERSRQFHRNLAERAARNRATEGYAGLDATAIVGVGQPTAETAELLANGTLSVDSSLHEMPRDGDGIVSRFSAEAAGTGGFAAHSLYLPQTHACLASDPIVLAHLRDLLADSRPMAAPPDSLLPRLTVGRTPAGAQRIVADGLAVSVAKPFYQVGQSVEIRAFAADAMGRPFDARTARIEVRIEPVGPGTKRARPIPIRMSAERSRPGWFVGRIKAPAPGTWFAVASAKHKLLAPFRAGDFFEIDAGR